MEWIDATRELPEYDQEVLYTDGKNIYLGHLEENNSLHCLPYWTHYDYLEDKGITHWMPFPEPPKE